MTTSFPMYLRAELIDAHRAYYALIKQHLSASRYAGPKDILARIPEHISEPKDLYEAWLSPDLFISQTCGMPYRTTLHGKVQLIGTPDYQLKDCKPGYYRSAIIVRREDANKTLTDLQHAIFAFNAKDSQSGYAAPYSLAQLQGFWFEHTVSSGSHRSSALAIATRQADIAAIDAMTWRLLTTHEAFTDDLSVLQWTKPTPGLPYITSLTNDATALFNAISAAINDLPADIRALLHIQSLIKISADDYLRMSGTTH